MVSIQERYILLLIMWSGQAQLGVNAFILVDKKYRVHIVFGDKNFYKMRAKLCNCQVERLVMEKDLSNRYNQNFAALIQNKGFATQLKITYFPKSEGFEFPRVEMLEGRIMAKYHRGRKLSDIVNEELLLLWNWDTYYVEALRSQQDKLQVIFNNPFFEA